MGLFGNWEKDKFCPTCFSSDGAFFGFNFICNKCKWNGPHSDLLNKNDMITLKRKKIIEKIKSKINVIK